MSTRAHKSAYLWAIVAFLLAITPNLASAQTYSDW